MWALPTIFTIPSQKRIMATLIILAMLIQPKKTPTLKNYGPPKKKRQLGRARPQQRFWPCFEARARSTSTGVIQIYMITLCYYVQSMDYI